MRLINLVIVFVMVCGLVLFSLENQGSVTIRVLPGSVELQLPLCIAILAAMMTGTILTSAVTVWVEIQNRLARGRDKRQIQEQEKLIKTLQEDVGRYKVDLEKRLQLERLQEELESYKAAIETEQRLLPGK
jgi:uncharacterized integral membrane protein